MNREMSSSAKDGGKQPEGDVVHAREGHVRRADHQRHHPVAEPAHGRGHDHEEHHDQAVRGDEDVEHFRIAEDLQPGSISSARMAIESKPPMTPPTKANTRYIVPMSLWLVE